MGHMREHFLALSLSGFGRVREHAGGVVAVGHASRPLRSLTPGSWARAHCPRWAREGLFERGFFRAIGLSRTSMRVYVAGGWFVRELAMSVMRRALFTAS